MAFSARWRLPMALVLGKSACRLVFLSLVGVRFLRRGFQRSLASAPGTRVGQVCLSPCVSWCGWRARVRFLRRGFQRSGRS